MPAGLTNMLTVDELMCVCISRQLVDGELVAQGIATPLVAAGYLLAKHTHAPNLVFVSAIGQAICQDPAPLGVATIEQLWIAQGLMRFSFVDAVCDLLPTYRPKEYFRPGQVDPYGNFNNIFMGGTYQRPVLRLPGSGGASDIGSFAWQTILIMNQSVDRFVPKLDFLTTPGYLDGPGGRARAGLPANTGPYRVITQLGLYDFDEETNRLRLIAVHPGITVDEALAASSFELLVAADVGATTPPTAEQLRLMHQLDPTGLILKR